MSKPSQQQTRQRGEKGQGRIKPKEDDIWSGTVLENNPIPGENWEQFKSQRKNDSAIVKYEKPKDNILEFPTPAKAQPTIATQQPQASPYKPKFKFEDTSIKIKDILITFLFHYFIILVLAASIGISPIILAMNPLFIITIFIADIAITKLWI